VTLPSHIFIDTAQDWQACLKKLIQEPRLAVDLEANSMFAYRERVCLIQISTASQDYIIDPEANLDLSGLGEIFADPTVEKVFHAAEYDLLLLKKAYGWELKNLFDTMWAARIIGHKRYGLASLLAALYDIHLDKRFQKSNWCKRPLSTDQLQYAQLDTHYLLRLRDDLDKKLQEMGRREEADIIFAEQCLVTPKDNGFSPNDFWSINGVNDLNEQQQAILKALTIFRNEEAERRDMPLFKIFGERTLLELAANQPQSLTQLGHVYGMSHRQVRRYGRTLLQIIAQAKNDPPPEPPPRGKRPPDQVLHRYEELRLWRKEKGKKRGVESDVIISRDALWTLARECPQTLDALAKLPLVGQWRAKKYGEEILAVLKEAG